MRQRRTIRNRRSMLKLLGLAAVGATAGVITGRVIDVADQDRAGAGVDGANGNGGNRGAPGSSSSSATPTSRTAPGAPPNTSFQRR